jgi:hypothetical protein
LQPNFFIETCGSIWGAIPPENSLEADTWVERIGEKTSPAVMVGHSAAGAITAAGRRLWPAKKREILVGFAQCCSELIFILEQ